jgi:hypothetical protein
MRILQKYVHIHMMGSALSSVIKGVNFEEISLGYFQWNCDKIPPIVVGWTKLQWLGEGASVLYS